ncbi:MAG TPA: hypothetical protein VHY35_12685 [Stellaceae bacterium]|jgi:hypothetical protein|nr:hypothetical protein [Stellaceae bacterium]
MVELLRAIRDTLVAIDAKLVEIKQRIDLLEGQYANLSDRVDRIDGRLKQVERRPALPTFP